MTEEAKRGFVNISGISRRRESAFGHDDDRMGKTVVSNDDGADGILSIADQIGIYDYAFQDQRKGNSD